MNKQNSGLYYLTVEWCKNGKRGIFCDDHLNCFVNLEQHTDEQMMEILGHFHLILDPKSESFTEEQLKGYVYWKPLAEFSHGYGILRKESW